MQSLREASGWSLKAGMCWIIPQGGDFFKAVPDRGIVTLWPLNSFLWQFPECLLPETFLPLFHPHQKVLTRHPFASGEASKMQGKKKIIHMVPIALGTYSLGCRDTLKGYTDRKRCVVNTWPDSKLQYLYHIHLNSYSFPASVSFL